MALPISKHQIHEECLRLVEEKIQTAKSAMEAAQASANNESKSSAGDKYETGRAMAQLERDKSAGLLADSERLKAALVQINPEKIHHKIQTGSVVVTDQGIFYLSIGLGLIQIAGTSVFVLSPASPLGKSFLNRGMGGIASFNGKEYLVKEIR